MCLGTVGIDVGRAGNGSNTFKWVIDEFLNNPFMTHFGWTSIF